MVTSEVGNIKLMETKYTFIKPSQGRRFDDDRRSNHIRSFFVQFLKPRRKNRDRRAIRTRPSQLDFHEPILLAVVLVTLSLCIFDVYATLTLMQDGAIELNPIMRRLISYNVWWFYGLKYGITVAGLCILLSYKNFRMYKSVTALHALYGVMIIYIVLAMYQVSLLYYTA